MNVTARSRPLARSSAIALSCSRAYGSLQSLRFVPPAMERAAAPIWLGHPRPSCARAHTRWGHNFHNFRGPQTGQRLQRSRCPRFCAKNCPACPLPESVNPIWTRAGTTRRGGRFC